MKISVFALFRDSERTIDKSLSRFSDILEISGIDVEFFFYENDSKDNTRSIILDWAKDKPVKFFYEDIQKPKFGSVSDTYRLVLLSYYRNKLKELAGPVDSDFCLLVDSDIIFDNSHIELLIKESINDWVMITPNVRSYQIKDLMFGESDDSFYDTFAMRDKYFNEVLKFVDCPFILNSDRKLWYSGKPVEVGSAFGGLALVRSHAYNEVKWSTNRHSEHVNFCTELRRFGKICILPECKPKSEIDIDSVNIQALKKIAKDQEQVTRSVNSCYDASINTYPPRQVVQCMMKVLLISDLGIHHDLGGAQRSNQIIVDEGMSRGHDIQCFHYDSDFKVIDSQYDIVISSNLEIISNRYPKLVESIPSLVNHVRLEHDSNLYWNDEFRKRFWGSCKLSFFLTKFHHDFFVEMYGNIFPNVRIVPDPIDSSFKDLKLDRTDKIGYVGFMHYLKGTDNFIDYADQNKDKKFAVAGWGSEEYVKKIKDRENIEFLGKINHDQMLEFYNRIESLYYNPVCNEPFCRAVGEAILCGVPNLVVNDIIGCVHEESRLGFDEFKNSCNNAAANFWEMIENDFNSMPN